MPASLTQSTLFRLFAFLTIASLPSLWGNSVIGAASELYASAFLPNPYWVPGHFWTLYVACPIVALSACLLFLSPGLLLALAWNLSRTAAEWCLYGFGLSLLVVSLAAGLAQQISGSAPRGRVFWVIVYGCAAACGALLLVRLRRGAAPASPFASRLAGQTLASMAIAVLAGAVLLAPKLYWENFTSDGLEAFAPGVLLLRQPVPFWPEEAGHVSSFPGTTSMLFAYPISWFVRLFGEWEAAARLPFLLYLAALFSGVLAVIEQGREHRSGQAERWLIWLALATFTAVTVYSSTYEPYSADIALPTAEDTLLMACLFGFVHAFLTRRSGAIALFAFLTFTAEANGLVLMLFWLASVWLVWRPRPRAELLWPAASVAGCLAFAALLPPLLGAAGLPRPGSEHSLVQLLYKFNFLQWEHWQRFLYAAVPGGILPFCALLAWRRQDPTARALTLTSAAYFLLFYIQAFTTLHYFVPAMLLPLAVFWRLNFAAAGATARRWMTGAAAAAGMVALILSWPANRELHTTARAVADAVEDRTPALATVDPAAFRRSEILWKLLPSDWEPEVPRKTYGGSALVWDYYARRGKAPRAGAANYVLQLASAAPPPEGKLIATHSDVALYVLREDVWKQHRAMQPPTPAGNPMYAVPRWMLFGLNGYPRDGGPSVINLLELIARSGFDVKEKLRQWGLKRNS